MEDTMLFSMQQQNSKDLTNLCTELIKFGLKISQQKSEFCRNNLTCMGLTFMLDGEVLLLLKKDNTTGSLYLCNFLFVLSVIMISFYTCTSVHVYTIIVHTDYVAVYMCPCFLLAIACMIHY